MTLMRTTLTLTALAACLAATPVLAQVQQGNPNAANQSMATQNALRSAQQSQTTQSNTTMMNLERSQNAPPAPAAPYSLPRGGVSGR